MTLKKAEIEIAPTQWGIYFLEKYTNHWNLKYIGLLGCFN